MPTSWPVSPASPGTAGPEFANQPRDEWQHQIEAELDDERPRHAEAPQHVSRVVVLQQSEELERLTEILDLVRTDDEQIHRQRNPVRGENPGAPAQVVAAPRAATAARPVRRGQTAAQAGTPTGRRTPPRRVARTGRSSSTRLLRSGRGATGSRCRRGGTRRPTRRPARAVPRSREPGRCAWSGTGSADFGHQPDYSPGPR